MKQFNSIKTERLLIRKLEPKDENAFFQYRSLPEVCRYQSWRPQDLSEMEDFIRRNSEVHFNTGGTWTQLAVCHKEGQMIGDIGLHFLEDNCQVEIGYTLSPQCQGSGYATEAVKGIINYVFAELKKHRVTASVDPDNIKSIRLLERVGMRKEAHFIKSFPMDGKWYDDCVYAVLEKEWKISSPLNF